MYREKSLDKIASEAIKLSLKGHVSLKTRIKFGTFSFAENASLIEAYTSIFSIAFQDVILHTFRNNRELAHHEKICLLRHNLSYL
jgi:hypothetical protein